MKWLRATLDWLDGKKSAIGSGALALAGALPNKSTLLFTVLYYFGVFTSGAGAIHKTVKGEFGELPEGLKKLITKRS